MHGLPKEDRALAFKTLRERALDSRIAHALDTLKDVDAHKPKDVADRQTFKRLGERDRKLLYQKYGFSDSDNDEEGNGERRGSSRKKSRGSNNNRSKGPKSPVGKIIAAS